jgi:hypothetical protein
MTLDEFFLSIEEANARIPGLHTTHPGATPAQIEPWQRERGIDLPADLVELLRRSDGVGLKQDWYEGEPLFHEGAFRIYPLREITPAAKAIFGMRDGEEAPYPEYASWLVIGMGPESALYIVFDTRERIYLTVNAILLDEVQRLGPLIGPLLDILDPINPYWAV